MVPVKTPGVYVYASGDRYCSACAPKGMAREEIERQVNEAKPAGEGLRWRISEDKTFRTGETMPYTCPQNGCNEHWLLVC